MTEQHYLRKLQKHGTGRESHYPPEVCEALGIDAGEDVDFVIGPGNIVTLRKPGNTATVEQDQQKVNSPMDPEKAITLFYSKRGRIISGRRGCGKTSLAKKFCQDYWRIIYYDPLGEYTEGVYFEDLQKFESFWADVQRRRPNGNFRIIFRPADPEGEFELICELVNKHKDLFFLVENLDRYCEPYISLPLKKLIRNGWEHQIELIATTENPQAIDKLLTRDAEQIYQLVSLPTQRPDFDVLTSDER